MAYTDQQVLQWFLDNPNATDAQIAQTAAAAGVSAEQLSRVTSVPVAEVEARVAAAAPSVQLPPPAPVPVLTPAPVANTWDYGQYVDALKTGGDLGEQVNRLATQNPDLAAAAGNLYGEITAQQQAGSSEFWYAGNTAGKEYAAADFALRLAENGISSLSQLGQITIPGYDTGEGTTPDQQVTINNLTGEPLPRPELLGRGTRALDLDYNLAFAADGTVIPFTSNRESSWMNFRENTLKPAAAFALATLGAPLIGAAVAPAASAAVQGAIGGAVAGGGTAALTGNDILKGALLGGAGGYLSGSFGASPGTSLETDASFLAADAAQLAKQGISQSQIVDILSAPGYASTAAANLAASMAVNGLDVGTMTKQLDALSSNTGLYQQNLSQGEFGAYDALGLRDVVGNDFAAIEQNLIASGVDPLIAADISQQLAFNPNITQSELASNLTKSFGNNIYDVDVAATYPTSQLPGAGGLLSDIPGAEQVSTSTKPTTEITPGKVFDAVKLGTAVASLVNAGSSTDTGKTGFDIVPVPSDWKTPTYTQPTGTAQGLAPIDFGSRELLRGTQWEKYLQPQTLANVVNTISQQAMPAYAMPAYTPAPMEQIKTYADQPLTGIAAFKPTSMDDVMSIINRDNNVTASEAQALQLLSNPNLSSLPPQAAAAIANAVGSPRSYQDVVSSGISTPSNLGGMSPEVQRAYEIYQQSMILGAPRSIAEAAYSAAGVNPTNPDAFFANLGLPTGTPTQDALAKYAPMALDQFAKSGGGALTYTIDPSTIPVGYTPPNVPTLANQGLNAYVNSIQNSTLSDQKKIELISAQSQKYGVDPATYLGTTYGQTPSGTVG